MHRYQGLFHSFSTAPGLRTSTTRRWADEQGAASILGLHLPPQRIDLVYSTWILHYLERLPVLIATVHQTRRPGGRFIFPANTPRFHVR
ncbi:MAG: methyltransferase domain-containing protein [Achromobacter sp.]|uniref:methyltransferase domain-containing protein n=1 Tax=Achromobacter sp. TaxID=134375 RepID=UPI003CFE4CE1